MAVDTLLRAVRFAFTPLLLICLVSCIGVSYGFSWTPSDTKLAHPIIPAANAPLWLAVWSVVPLLLTICMWLSVNRIAESLDSASVQQPEQALTVLTAEEVLRNFSPVEIIPWAIVGFFGETVQLVNLASSEESLPPNLILTAKHLTPDSRK